MLALFLGQGLKVQGCVRETRAIGKCPAEKKKVIHILGGCAEAGTWVGVGCKANPKIFSALKPLDPHNGQFCHPL